MPDNDIPAAKPDSEAQPGEFDFSQPPTLTPRVKRRSLKTRIAKLKPADGAPAAARELEHEAPPLVTPQAAPAPESDEVEIQKPASSKPHYASTVQPSHPANAVGETPHTTAKAQGTTSPHATRPATLYYTNAPRRDREATPPAAADPTSASSTSPTASSPSPSMKSTTPTGSTASTSTSVTRPASSVRPATISDFRSNAERQSREQKSVGGILSILVYSLIFAFVVGIGLAGYGAYIVSQQLQQQSATVHQLDQKYTGEVASLNTKLASTIDSLTQAQAQVAQQQDLISKQQELIAKLAANAATNADALKTERSTRASEMASLRARVKALEYHGPSSQQRY